MIESATILRRDYPGMPLFVETPDNSLNTYELNQRAIKALDLPPDIKAQPCANTSGLIAKLSLDFGRGSISMERVHVRAARAVAMQMLKATGAMIYETDVTR